MIFAFSRVFAIPFHRVNGHFINREITRKKQTYAKIASHRNHRNFITNTDFTDLTDFLILRPQYPFCDFRAFCVRFSSRGFLILPRNIDFRMIFAFSRVFAIPSQFTVKCFLRDIFHFTASVYV